MQPFPEMEQPRRPSEPSSPIPPAQPAFDGRAVPRIVGGIGIAVVGGRLTSYALHALSAPLALTFLAFWGVIFGVLWLTAKRVSERFGSGNPWRDFGFRWRPSDLWRGLVAYIAATILGGLAVMPWAGHTSRLDYTTARMIDVSPLAFAIWTVSAIVAAPVFEELVFRGALQRSLTDRLGASKAIVGQAAVFGAYHLAPGLGGDNLPYFLSLFCFALVMGWLARHLGRLGGGVTAHVIANGLVVVNRAAARS